MKLKKLICTSILAISTSGFALLAHAGDLTLIDKTDTDSTSIITNGLKICTSYLDKTYGITRAGGTPNVIPDSKVREMCLANVHNCIADIYLSDSCGGNKIATVTFDIDSGVKGNPVEYYPDQYHIVPNGLTISLVSLSKNKTA